MRVNVDVLGVGQLERWFGETQQHFNSRVKEAMGYAGLKMETVAKINAPVKKGFLKNSIRYKSEDSGMSAQIETNIKYAPKNEFFHKTKSRFMKKGQIAGYDEFIRVFNR